METKTRNLTECVTATMIEEVDIVLTNKHAPYYINRLDYSLPYTLIIYYEDNMIACVDFVGNYGGTLVKVSYKGLTNEIPLNEGRANLK